MKRHVKRVLPVLALFALVALIAACAPAATPTAAPAATSAPAATAAPAPGSGGVVNVWTDGDTNISDWLANKVGPAFQKAYPQYTVKVTTVRGVGNGVTDIANRALAAHNHRRFPCPQARSFISNSPPKTRLPLANSTRTSLGGRSRWIPISITTNSPPQIRIDGQLKPMELPPLSAVETRQLCYSVLTEAQKHKFEEDNELDLSFGVAAVVLIVLRLGTVLPQAPGNVGAFQFFTVMALRLFGVDRATAIGFATMMFVVVTVPLWLAGLVAVAMTGMKIRDLQHHAQRTFRTSEETATGSEARR